MNNMEQLYNWIRNIAYYLIFITVVLNLLPGKKYEKYIKFFAGMVLILLVLKPLTGSLNLDEKLAYYFKTISFSNEAGELSAQISKMDEKRLKKMIGSYEEAVGVDLKSMAETAGFGCKKVSAEIDKNQDNVTFGHVIRVSMILKLKKDEKKEKIKVIEGIEKVEDIQVKIKESQADDKDQFDVSKKKKEENLRLSGLRRRIAEYYDLEEQDIEIQVEDGKG